VDVPFNEIGYYAATLAICSIVHELGHALAAAREDVQLFGLGIVIVFTIPIAYVRISNEQLVALPLRNQLRIACAGIWHNIILATIAAAILVFSTWLWAPFYNIGSGVYVKTILPVSDQKRIIFYQNIFLFYYSFIVEFTCIRTNWSFGTRCNIQIKQLSCKAWRGLV